MKRWVQVAGPQLTIVFPQFTRGSSIRAIDGDAGLADAAPIVTLNVGARTVGAYLPGHGKEAWGLDPLYGSRFDPLDNGYEAEVRGGRLLVWLLRWPGDGGSPRDLALLDTGWQAVDG